MAMSVQTNQGALSALRYLNTNQMNMNSALGRLSSGFRINTAADDAAGYAIAAKMQGERGMLQAANQNALQATAMVKSADAGLNEIENMLRRLQVLATQAASANNSGGLAKLEGERARLHTQIDKIANGTTYNGVNVLNGTAGGTAALATPIAGITINGASSTAVAGASTISTTVAAAATGFAAGDSITVTDSAGVATTAVITTLPAAGQSQTLTIAGIKITIDSAIKGTAANAGTSLGTVAPAKISSFQVGGQAGIANNITADFTKDNSTAGLGFVATDNFATQASASAYLAKVTTALSTLVNNRAALGATQNQLGYASANLATNIQQLTSSISTIRDADMATEMANFTKNQVMVQAGTSMLAQAKQTAKNVLTLFR